MSSVYLNEVAQTTTRGNKRNETKRHQNDRALQTQTRIQGAPDRETPEAPSEYQGSPTFSLLGDTVCVKVNEARRFFFFFVLEATSGLPRPYPLVCVSGGEKSYLFGRESETANETASLSRACSPLCRNPIFFFYDVTGQTKKRPSPDFFFVEGRGRGETKNAHSVVAAPRRLSR